MRIGVHGGTFHCDDVLACFMLHETTPFKTAKIVRTRDPELLEKMDAVVDVGGVYCAERFRYDHHQRGFDEKMTELGCDTKLSSVGLVYRHHGADLIASLLKIPADSETLQLIYKNIYRSFVEAIDGHDNGISQYREDVAPRYLVTTSLTSRIARMNPEWNEDAQNIDHKFQEAMAVAGAEFTDHVRRMYYTWLPARTIVEKSISERFDVDKSGQIVVLDRWCPWNEHLLDIEASTLLGSPLRYVIFSSNATDWRVQAVPSDVGSYVSRLSLPKALQGMSGEKLSTLAGIPDCVFVHANGFVGGAKTYESALKLAKKALEEIHQ